MLQIYKTFLIYQNILLFIYTMKYESPKIIEERTIQIEPPLLAGSVVTKDSEVESVGQEVVNHTPDTFDANGNSL